MKKILIVDDEASIRFLISETLEINDYEIYEAEDGQEAIDMTNKNEFDLLLLDVMMPKLTGYEVAKTLKENKNKRKPEIIMLTAKGQQKDREEGFKNGADYFLTKPFSPIELLELVEEILG
ncbi:response regulator [Romboutsia sp.]|uniref:response regulator transcription factor n=1 Tax=Romboutsia sp. TaxID=1965302 RepID=UPI002C50668F|nr:response regulator [Romboutsia sp.]HSQ87537.1 response regulator [Romboutsia sp.]